MASWFGGGKKDAGRQEIAPPPPAAPAALPAAEDPEKLKRVGRAQLISTSARGVLGNATTSGKQLSI